MWRVIHWRTQSNGNCLVTSDWKGGLVAVMKWSEKLRGKWMRRAGGERPRGGGSAGADRIRRGVGDRWCVLPARSARRISDGSLGVDEPRHQDPVPGRRTARGLPARRPARAGRLQRLGHRNPGVRVVLRLRAFDRHAGRRPVELLRRLVPAVAGQRSGLHLQVGDVPDPGTACLRWRPTRACRRTATPWSASRWAAARR